MIGTHRCCNAGSLHCVCWLSITELHIEQVQAIKGWNGGLHAVDSHLVGPIHAEEGIDVLLQARIDAFVTLVCMKLDPSTRIKPPIRAPTEGSHCQDYSQLGQRRVYDGSTSDNKRAYKSGESGVRELPFPTNERGGKGTNLARVRAPFE